MYNLFLFLACAGFGAYLANRQDGVHDKLTISLIKIGIVGLVFCTMLETASEFVSKFQAEQDAKTHSTTEKIFYYEKIQE